MTGNAIEAVALSKRFLLASERRTSLKERLARGRAPAPKTFWALKDVTFSVPKGSSLGLVGQNGSGKSTALKVLTGIYRPTSGRVTVNGSVSALLEVGAGFHPELTGRENIRLNATILGFTGREIDRLMDQIIEFADIGDHIDGPIKHYSSGMYVRLGFAVAVMVRPDILLVDEVIAVGDEEFQRKCYEYLFDLRRAGTSLVVVSHGLQQITDLCDEAVWLQRGEVMELGPSRHVVRAYLESVNQSEVERIRGRAVETHVPSTGSGDVETGGAAAGAVFVDIQEGQLPVRPSRRGSGRLWVTGVEYLDETGNIVGMLVSGRNATFRVHYRAEEDVVGAILGFGFFDHAQTVVAGVNTGHLPNVDLPRGLGYFEFHARPLLLSGGNYHVSARFHIGSHVLDDLGLGIPLVVREPDVAVAGAYLQPGSWDVHPRPLRGVRTTLGAQP